MVEHGHHPELARESAAERSLRLMAEEALKLMTGPRAKDTLSNAVWQVLTNARVNEGERAKLHEQVLRKAQSLQRQDASKKRASETPSQPMASEVAADARRRLDKAQLYRDAFAHEKRQPRDAYAADHEEQDDEAA